MASAWSAEDIAVIQAPYGAAKSTAPGSGPPPPAPAPPPPPAPAPSALSIVIASPGANFSTGASSISALGTVSGGSGTLRVTWANDRGGSGSASGNANWTIPWLPLSVGANQITVTFSDGAGKTPSKTFLATR